MARFILFLVGILVEVSAVAHSSTIEQEVTVLSRESVEAYRSGQYDRAVQLLTRAYAIQPLPILLFNLAKAYEKLNDLPRAKDFYEKYLASGMALPKYAQKAQTRVAEIAAELAKQQAAIEKPPPAPPPVVPPAPVVVKPPAPPPPLPVDLWQVRRPKLAAWATSSLLVALGSLGAGVGLYLSVASLHSQYEASLDEVTKRKLRVDADRRGIASSVMYGAAGLAAVSGFCAIYLLVRHPAKEARSAALSPTIAPIGLPAGAGAVAAWSF